MIFQQSEQQVILPAFQCLFYPRLEIQVKGLIIFFKKAIEVIIYFSASKNASQDG